jgi:hypothetical protein
VVIGTKGQIPAWLLGGLMVALTAALTLGACKTQQGSAPPPRREAQHYRLDLGALARGEQAALLAALRMPRGEIHRRLGAHRQTASSKLELAGGVRKQTLAQQLTLAVDAKGRFSIVKSTSPEHGVELRWVGDKLYPRRRFGKFYARAARDPAEPTTLAERIAGLLPAYMRLLERFVDVELAGKESAGGRPALRVKLKARATARPAPRQRQAASKRWRRSLAVASLTGVALLDAKTGAPLSIKLSARWTFRAPPTGTLPPSGIPTKLGGQQASATLAFEQRVTFGAVVVAAPKPGEVIDVRRRRLEVERQIVQGERPLPPAWRERWGDIQR